MSQRLLIAWAVGASVVAISALSYIAGKHAGSTSSEVPAARTATSLPYSDPRRPDTSPPPYEVPAALASGPREWRTASDDVLAGYAALFDPARREVILEQCLHRGYSLDEQGRPLMTQPEFCVPVLWAQFVALTDKTAVVVARDGREIELRIDADFADPNPTLRLRFGEHDARLIPGTKNDLLQTMERHPRVVERKRRFLLAIAAMENEQRTRDAARTLPSFTLPASQDAPGVADRTD